MEDAPKISSLKALARASRIPRSTLAEWRDKGWIVSDGEGNFDVEAALAIAAEREKEGRFRRRRAGNERDADHRLKLAKARREELRLEEDRRRLLDTAEVREGLASVLQPLLIQLGNVSHRCPVVEARGWIDSQLRQIISDAEGRARKAFARHPMEEVEDDDGDD